MRREAGETQSPSELCSPSPCVSRENVRSLEERQRGEKTKNRRKRMRVEGRKTGAKVGRAKTNERKAKRREEKIEIELGRVDNRV